MTHLPLILQMPFCMNRPDEMYVTTFPHDDVCRLHSFKNSQNNSDYQWGMAMWGRINNLLEAFDFFQQYWQRFYECVDSQKTD